MRSPSSHTTVRRPRITDDDIVESIGTLSKRTIRLIDAYLKSMPEPMPDVPLLRSRTSKPYSKDILARDFRRIRAAEFPGDKRWLLDFRRSGTVEAVADDVQDTALSAKLNNSIGESKELQRTYIPKRAATVRLGDEARKRARSALRERKESKS